MDFQKIDIVRAIVSLQEKIIKVLDEAKAEKEEAQSKLVQAEKSIEKP